MSDLISRRMMLDKMIRRKSLFSTNQYEYMALSEVDKARADEIDNCITDLRNAPCPETGNDPLTWDELKQMEGKPIWLEWLVGDIWSDPNHRESCTWWVVGEVRKNDIIIAQYLDEAELCEDDLGVIWLAYSKEKNE